jgi:hypothetical protein
MGPIGCVRSSAFTVYRGLRELPINSFSIGRRLEFALGHQKKKKRNGRFTAVSEVERPKFNGYMFNGY